MLGTDKEPGIYVRTLNDLFRAIEETSDDMLYSVSMSYLEVGHTPNLQLFTQNSISGGLPAPCPGFSRDDSIKRAMGATKWPMEAFIQPLQRCFA